jgi:hypothetical protein
MTSANDVNGKALGVAPQLAQALSGGSDAAVDPIVHTPRIGHEPLPGHPVRPGYEPHGQCHTP